jgi:hypothetical protein
MELGDRAIGFLLLLFSTTLFAYYTFWVIITVRARIRRVTRFVASKIGSNILIL